MTDTTSNEQTGPCLSVVIPHLNQPELLARCLRSLTDQQLSDEMEIIVVDNGSTTLPSDVVDAVPTAQLTSETTPGPGPARSSGAHKARADLLAFIDADCTAEQGWAQAVLDTFAAHPDIAVIGGDVCILAEDPQKLTALEAYESVWGYRNQMYVEKHGYSATLNMAVRRSAFLTVGDFGGIDVAEDADWGHRAGAAGLQMAFVPGMAVATPARASMDELRRKWERHLQHDRARLTSVAARLGYLARATIVGTSPLAELIRVARTQRIEGFRTRSRAWRCMARIRMYRTRRMLSIALGQPSGSAADAWRSESRKT